MGIRPGFETILATYHACSTNILLNSYRVKQNRANERKALLQRYSYWRVALFQVINGNYIYITSQALKKKVNVNLTSFAKLVLAG